MRKDEANPTQRGGSNRRCFTTDGVHHFHINMDEAILVKVV